MHLLLKAMDISLTRTRRDDPYLVSTISKINRKPLGDRWNTTDHWRILISNDHYAHCYSSVVVSPISSTAGASAGAATSSASAAAASSASSAISARVAATFAIPSLGSVMSVKLAGSWTSSACSI